MSGVVWLLILVALVAVLCGAYVGQRLSYLLLRKKIYIQENAFELLMTERSEEWNEFRLQNPKWIPQLWKKDFSGLSLENTNFCAKLTGASFEETILDGSNFYRADLTGANFKRASLVAVTFDEADLTQASFDGARLEHASWKDVKLEKVTPDSVREAASRSIEHEGSSASQLLEQAKREPMVLDRLDPRQLEELVAEVFRRIGYEVFVASPTHNMGYDLHMVHSEPTGERRTTLVAVKKYAAHKRIGVATIRVLLVAMDAHTADYGMIVTTNTFTRSAQQVSEDVPQLRFVDGARLREFIAAATQPTRDRFENGQTPSERVVHLAPWELTAPITDAQIQELAPFLSNLQGNILRGHGRDRTTLMFFQFRKDGVSRVKEWMRSLAPYVTSMRKQMDDTEQYRQSQFKIPGGVFCSVFLSAEGYRLLGIEPPDDPAFREGMRGRSTILHDPPTKEWELAYQQNIHAMVLLAYHDQQGLGQEVARLKEATKEFTERVDTEEGLAMRKDGQWVEHFGYMIGRSQPLFFQSDVERERFQRDGISVWDPSAGPNLVLVQDPHSEIPAAGSYLVFRKLEQNVRSFTQQVQDLAASLGLSGEDIARAGALVMGRFQDGTPVVLQATVGRHNPVPNNFTYADDPDGQKCPLQAHIRKVNPRDVVVSSKARRLARRGITYGRRAKEPKDNPSLDELPENGVGLLFMCYQRDIAAQFEFLHTQLANNAHAIQRDSGIDPIIGQVHDEPLVPQKWPHSWGTPREEQRQFYFHGCVTLKGGEYFFAPSITFLQQL